MGIGESGPGGASNRVLIVDDEPGITRYQGSSTRARFDVWPMTVTALNRALRETASREGHKRVKGVAFQTLRQQIETPPVASGVK